MIEVKQISSKKDIKKFVDFPTKLYKGCKEYSYPFRMDEIAMFNPKKNVSYADCDVATFLAYKNGKIVGRIAGIIQKKYNNEHKKNNVRFTRFDAINDEEVAKALFDAVETWAKAKGMDTIHGPLGFSDLDCEGMIVEGFDEMCTFEERYNFKYYKDLMEKCGFIKDVDWLERKIYAPKEIDPKVARIADAVQKRYKLRFASEKSKNKLIDKYQEQIFNLVDLAYKELYGVVELNEGMRKQLLSQFKLYVNLKYMIVIVNDKDEVISFGVALPALNKALYKSKGRITLPAIFRLLKALAKPKVVDFAILAVRPDYQNKGVNALTMKYLMDNMAKFGVEYCETNICLEENVKINQTWEYFKHDQHRRRRAWKKSIN